MAAPPSRPPEHHHSVRGPSPSLSLSDSTARRLSDLSPPLIAMMAVLATALLIVLYVRLLSRPVRLLRRRFTRWRRRRSRLSFSSADLENSPAPNAGDYLYYYYSSGAASNYFISPYGLDDSAIKALPLSLFSNTTKGKHLYKDCAVCLVEFDDGDSLRTLPICSHVFHADCIDVWLRSHANCPLCRAAIFRHDSSPFVPMRAARIRPSFDDLLLNPPPLLASPQPLPPPPPLAAEPDYSEIEAEAAGASPARRTSREEERYEGRDFLLERSYSFGFERNLAADQTMMTMESSIASPWSYRHRSFWSKRWPSPFITSGGGSASSSRAARVFSFRSYRGGNAGRSPFARKRGVFFPLSESRAGPSSRRTRSLTSPVSFFSRSWGGAGGGLPAAASVAGSGSSRLRCGDPEALLSPERLNRQ